MNYTEKGVLFQIKITDLQICNCRYSLRTKSRQFILFSVQLITSKEGETSAFE